MNHRNLIIILCHSIIDYIDFSEINNKTIFVLYLYKSIFINIIYFKVFFN